MELDILLTQISELLHRSMDYYARESIHESGFRSITVGQLFYLEAIHNLNGPTMSELAEHMNVSRASASVAVKKLMRKGLVKKKTSQEDRRVIHIYITPRGDSIIQAKNRAFSEFFKIIRSSLTKREIDELTTIILKIIVAHTL